MLENKSVLAIIPARGGSKGIPHKNIADVNGRPLISYTISAAKDCPYIDRILVSTDDGQIAKISREYGADVPFLRPDYLSSDTAKSIDAVLHAIDFCKVNDRAYDIVILLQPTSPLRTGADVTGALDYFVQNHCDSLLSLTEIEEHPVLTRQMDDETKRLKPILSMQSTVRRQDMQPFYHVNGAIYINYCRDLTRETSLNDNHYGYVIPSPHGLDIDTLGDLELAGYYLAKETGGCNEKYNKNKGDKDKMEELLKVLEQFDDCIDFKEENALMTDGVIDSVRLVELVGELEDHFGVDISLDEVLPENFDSAEYIWNMIQRLKK